MLLKYRLPNISKRYHALRAKTSELKPSWGVKPLYNSLFLFIVCLFFSSCSNNSKNENIRSIIHNHGMEVSIAMVSIIVICALLGYVFILYQKKKDKLLYHRGFIEMIPSLISTLGVLGTFAGITMGLYYFETSDLSQSIPLLLNGLKTAFFTSLAGMICSLILSSQINRLFDEKTGGVSDSTEAAGIIVKAVHALQEASEKQAQSQTLFYNATQQLVKKIDTSIEKLSINSEAINLALNTIGLETSAIKGNQVSLEGKTDSILLSVGNIEETEKNLLNKTIEQAGHVGEMLDHTEALVSGQDTISGHVSKFGDRLHGEIVEIEDKMSETNKLLNVKFDEFSELLKKSNTEALVEVMKKVTEEFQKQMNALINKLIQENFDQLNKSVERLNTWQQENKEMIQSLTSQYKQMAENFESTSTSLTKVDEDTRQLVSEGGKLHQIVDALNKVIVEDEKFLKISSDLQNTAGLTKTNFEQFDASTKLLNDWVKKQRNFVDGVMVLINKLEELNKIKDYGEEFWKRTRESMNEGVGIIKGGTDTLNRQVAGLNDQFYARLSTTLAQLDNCIQALITKAERR